MRISTSLLYDTNVSTINRQQSNLLHLQQQVATGRQVLTPSDDPVAASRSLEVSQSVNKLSQQTENQGAANDSLTMYESKLTAISEIITYAKERAIQAGNGAIGAQDRRSIATDIRGQFDSLFGISNATDSDGQHMFSGYQGDTVPFTGSITGGVTYQGDQGQRTLQVSDSRVLPVSNTGDEVFMRIDNLNGAFNTRPGSANAGGAIISDGTVVGAYANGQYGIKFTSASAYSIYNRATDPTMTGVPLGSGVYTDGTPINLPPLPAAAQIQVTIAGTPATGETFQIDPGGTTDLFNILQQFVGALENTSGTSYRAAITDTLGRLDNGLENILRLRAQIGSRQVEVDALKSVGEDLKVQYADRMERLVGLDYVGAISDLQQQQTYLDASRQTFVKVTGMTLFDFLS